MKAIGPLNLIVPIVLQIGEEFAFPSSLLFLSSCNPRLAIVLQVMCLCVNECEVFACAFTIVTVSVRSKRVSFNLLLAIVFC